VSSGMIRAFITSASFFMLKGFIPHLLNIHPASFFY
jgi:hypothetical protein